MKATTKTAFYILVVSIFIGGCTPGVQIKKDGQGEEIKTVSYLWLSCSNLYDFTKDCNTFSGAERKIKLEGYELRLGSTEDGRHLLIMDSSSVAHQLSRALLGLGNPYALYDPTFHPYPKNQTAKSGFEAVVNRLNSSGIKLTDVIAIMDWNQHKGYILSLDDNGYEILVRPTTSEPGTAPIAESHPSEPPVSEPTSVTQASTNDADMSVNEQLEILKQRRARGELTGEEYLAERRRLIYGD